MAKVLGVKQERQDGAFERLRALAVASTTGAGTGVPAERQEHDATPTKTPGRRVKKIITALSKKVDDLTQLAG